VGVESTQQYTIQNITTRTLYQGGESLDAGWWKDEVCDGVIGDDSGVSPKTLEKTVKFFASASDYTYKDTISEKSPTYSGLDSGV
jgi:hypothetical protein